MIPFIKASACGNDFLLIDLAPPAQGQDLAELTRRICDRHHGIGADGVEWLSPDAHADARLRLFNADGSRAEVSGNGTRCVAAWLISQHLKERVKLRTDAGIRECSLLNRSGERFEIETNMGPALVGDSFSVRLAFREVTGTPVFIGNPHFVMFVDEFDVGWQAEAAEIGRHHDFKEGVNVELVRAQAPHAISVVFFERGAGETQSSGSGSCAAAVAAIAMGRAASPVEVLGPGGTQVVHWDGDVLLRGPAQLVARGEFLL